MIRPCLLLTLAISATTLMSAAEAHAQSFDGITIVAFADEAGKNPIAYGEHIVTFVSARGSYAAVVARKGTHGGCQSLAVPGSYTGSSIAFGVAADGAARRHRLQTYCPPFTLQFEDADTMRIEAPSDPATGRKEYASRQKVIAHVPLRAIDFESAAFTGHDLKGVRLGPVLNGEDVGGLTVRVGDSKEDRYKGFQRHVIAGDGSRRAVLGRAAAAEVTGWPWDVLYFAQYIEELERKSTSEAFEEAVRERYGEPSSRFEQTGYKLWAYDLDGRKLAFDEAGSDECRATIEFWVKTDPLKRINGFGWELNSHDIGPWGCSVIMELSANRGDGGLSGYSIRAASGYVWAISHFLQRIGDTTELLEKVQALQGRKPKL